MGSVEVALERAPGDGGGRIVALKRMLPDAAHDPRHKEMFLREARLAALLDHPHVVHAFAFGEVDGELFLAMEYVEGEPLSRVLAEACGADGGLDPGVVAFVLGRVCDGLHAAHELRDARGNALHVVHRDVSPHNVMIGYEGQVKLLDFGVAKLETLETGGHETRTGEVKGKMAYMSPEQALGEKLDRRSDLFSIGAVLFECLTGRRMWGTGTDLEVMRKLALEAPPSLDEALPGAPRALVQLHARLVAHEPSARPPTALAVAEELRAFAATARVGQEAIRALMGGRFGGHAERRRSQLRQAMRSPGSVPVEAAEPIPPPRDAVATSPSLSSTRKRAARRLTVSLAAASAVVVGIVATAVVIARTPSAAAPLAAPSSPAAAPRAPPAPPDPTPSTRASAPSASSGAPPVPLSGGAPTAPGPKAAGARPRPRPHASSKPSSPPTPPATKLPDVDPAPF
jgi:serine/threonine-protein kinase